MGDKPDFFKNWLLVAEKSKQLFPFWVKKVLTLLNVRNVLM
jgi:hypothetical protein